MSRLQQNSIYAVILIIVIGFFWLIFPSRTPQPHGIYLPQTTVESAPISAQSVEYLPQFNGQPQGVIRVSIAVNSSNDFANACQSNINYAKALAAQHGMTKIIGDCQVPANIDVLSSANFNGFAYQ